MRWLVMAAALAVVAATWQFRRDLAEARAWAALGSTMVDTRCGPIEVQQTGQGPPVLVVHGSGGGHDQGMASVGRLAEQGVRVIAMSRFGYLRTPRPADASPEAQADAHVCLMDALGIPRAAIVGFSAGAASALQAAIRHPGRFHALGLVVPIVYKPGDVADSAPPISDDKDTWLLRLLGSDALFWALQRLAPDLLMRHLLATPPEEVAAASAAEQARVNALARRILPVSQRAQGLHDDTRLGKRLGPAPLDSIRMPTLLISARNDGFGTYAGAQYTAAQIGGARFVGFDHGGHLLVGHDEAVRAEILALVLRGLEAPGSMK